MKLKFKIQPYQTAAVESVIDCFAGQANKSGSKYRMDQGKERNRADVEQISLLDQIGFKNHSIQLTDEQLLANIHVVQRRQNLPLSNSLVTSAGCKVNLDVEMETGTGKTYCYTKTIFEMNKQYGWTKFIVMVPRVAIREGVLKSLEITSDHFNEAYGKKIRYFAYNSKQLHHLESFSSDAGINVMVITIQAFNSTGSDNLRIYEELDDFQSRRPIDVISSNRPILILDEPQKMEGRATMDALPQFNPMMILRYSATHRTTHNKVHRLDALDAYNQKLVKKIAVRGVSVKGLAGTNAYLYLESIEISKNAPVARIEMEVHQNNGIKRVVKRLERGANLFSVSNELDQYRGFVVSQIDAKQDKVEFTNGHILNVGDATGDITEMTIRRIQIREAIRAHFEKEQVLFAQGIKVLSLFFIDEVAKYRDYQQEDEQGEYARIFEEEYEWLKKEYMESQFISEAYMEHLAKIPVQRTHNGYFSIDRRSKRLIDPAVRQRGEEAGHSDDVDAYDLILKDKEQLLSLEEPVRFIFSHSALREGWDNPNIFVMCMLKHTDNTISRRQEVGRGLRISVNKQGERTDNPVTVHDVNILTVVANESYGDFVRNLQQEINVSLSERPLKADAAYFIGKAISTETGTQEITSDQAKHIEYYLIQNGYVDIDRQILDKYLDEKKAGNLKPLPPELLPYSEQIFALVDSVFSESQLPVMEDDRKPKSNALNANFEKEEFKALWSRINHKAIYQVDFDSSELIQNSIHALNKELAVTSLQYIIQSGALVDQLTDVQLKNGEGFIEERTTVETHNASIHSMVFYDLLGKISENTQLTRRTIAEILSQIQGEKFDKFKQNPEHFITECSRIINEQKATVIIERLSYDRISETHDIDIFTTGQRRQDFTRAGDKLKKHIYDYAITDSEVERNFVKELDTCTEVVVYAKLPRGFLIPTPVGDYNPDWAIVFLEGSAKHIYFVAETKGSLSSLDLRPIEDKKISCAHKFFDEVSSKIAPECVKYEAVTSFKDLMDLVESPVIDNPIKPKE